MDPITIATTCVGLVSAVGKIAISVTVFIRQARSAGNDVAWIRNELGQIKEITNKISDALSEPNLTMVPESLGKHLMDIIQSIESILDEIDKQIAKYSPGGMFRSAEWALSGHSDLDKLKQRLSERKNTLSICFDLLQYHVLESIKADTRETRELASGMRVDMNEILLRIENIRIELRNAQLDQHNIGSVEQWLDELTTYAETVYASSVADGTWILREPSSNEFTTPRNTTGTRQSYSDQLATNATKPDRHYTSKSSRRASIGAYSNETPSPQDKTKRSKHPPDVNGIPNIRGNLDDKLETGVQNSYVGTWYGRVRKLLAGKEYSRRYSNLRRHALIHNSYIEVDPLGVTARSASPYSNTTSRSPHQFRQQKPDSQIIWQRGVGY